jgi:hypothetical protein
VEIFCGECAPTIPAGRPDTLSLLRLTIYIMCKIERACTVRRAPDSAGHAGQRPEASGLAPNTLKGVD